MSALLSISYLFNTKSCQFNTCLVGLYKRHLLCTLGYFIFRVWQEQEQQKNLEVVSMSSDSHEEVIHCIETLIMKRLIQSRAHCYLLKM